jgi:hypothetical protein
MGSGVSSSGFPPPVAEVRKTALTCREDQHVVRPPGSTEKVRQRIDHLERRAAADVCPHDTFARDVKSNPFVIGGKEWVQSALWSPEFAPGNTAWFYTIEFAQIQRYFTTLRILARNTPTSCRRVRLRRRIRPYWRAAPSREASQRIALRAAAAHSPRRQSCRRSVLRHRNSRDIHRRSKSDGEQYQAQANI